MLLNTHFLQGSSPPRLSHRPRLDQTAQHFLLEHTRFVAICHPTSHQDVFRLDATNRLTAFPSSQTIWTARSSIFGSLDVSHCPLGWLHAGHGDPSVGLLRGATFSICLSSSSTMFTHNMQGNSCDFIPLRPTGFVPHPHKR